MHERKPLVLLAGPCAMESKDVCFETAEGLKAIAQKHGLDFYFKTSFDKANRTSMSSFRGLGMDEGLQILQDVKNTFGVGIVTDIHEPWQAEAAAQVADVIQIPAFLCRQTDLLAAAARTGRIVNVKKAQFLAPWDMKNVIGKLEEAGADKIMVCERGTSFGYNTLVVDMTSIPIMKSFGYPVIFDATHSVQKPGGLGTASGGDGKMAPYLAKAAMAVGADGFFMETHPDPQKALCDGPNMIALADMDSLIESLIRIRDAIEAQEGEDR